MLNGRHFDVSTLRDVEPSNVDYYDGRQYLSRHVESRRKNFAPNNRLSRDERSYVCMIVRGF
jgi:hypothetical protein